MSDKLSEWGGSSQTHEIFVKSPPNGWKPRTYGLTPDLIQKVDSLAATYEVGQSDMVRFLLLVGLREVESDRVKVPTKTIPGRIIDEEW